MDKEDVISICDYLSIYLLTYHSAMREKRKSPAICNNMDGPWGNYAKWGKTDKDNIIYM